MNPADPAAEAAIAALIERVRLSGRAAVRDRMTVAAVLKADGDIEAADWIYDNPRRYAHLVSTYAENGEPPPA